MGCRMAEPPKVGPVRSDEVHPNEWKKNYYLLRQPQEQDNGTAFQSKGIAGFGGLGLRFRLGDRDLLFLWRGPQGEHTGVP